MTTITMGTTITTTMGMRTTLFSPKWVPPISMPRPWWLQAASGLGSHLMS